MSSCLKTSKARRMRDVATKRRLFETAAEKPHLTDHEWMNVSHRLYALEFKIDMLLGSSGIYAGAWPSEPGSGIPGNVLQQQCDASRRIQRAWRHFVGYRRRLGPASKRAGLVNSGSGASEFGPAEPNKGRKHEYACNVPGCDSNLDAPPFAALSCEDPIPRDMLLAYRYVQPAIEEKVVVLCDCVQDADSKCEWNYKIWAPASQDVFAGPSVLRGELQREAATLIQQYVKRQLLQPTDSAAPEGCADKDLHSIWLPVEEWKLATGMVKLDRTCIEENWVGQHQGLRDFDVGLWFRAEVASSDQQGSELEIWAVNEVKTWYQTLLEETDTHLAPQSSILGRTRAVVIEWSRIRLQVPVAVRQIFAEGVLNHVDTLRRAAYG